MIGRCVEYPLRAFVVKDYLNIVRNLSNQCHQIAGLRVSEKSCARLSLLCLLIRFFDASWGERRFSFPLRTRLRVIWNAESLSSGIFI